METLNKVILSIGSNQNDRLTTIVESLQLINHQIGEVAKISKWYKTPSWGFESDFFINIAILVNTPLSEIVLLEAVKTIENTLGRVQHNQPGYADRPIDIDIIDFNNVIFSSPSLHIPHLLMHNRLFVLLPLKDISPDYVHPMSKKKVTTLINECSDNSVCTIVENATSFSIEKNAFKNGFIVIEGNIGAGKTSLTHKLANDCNGKIILERFADNPFLPLFYKNQERYAFSLEMAFLLDRYEQVSNDFKVLNIDNQFVVADYHVGKSLLFAKTTLPELEYSLYEKTFNIIYKSIPQPDLYVFLNQSSEQLLQNIKKRGRDFEQNIASDYLDKINENYQKYIAKLDPKKVLIIDVSDMDFVNNPNDYVIVKEAIKVKMLSRDV